MAQAYSAGLTVTEQIVLKKERRLPIKGKVLVKVGDIVKGEEVVAETLLPGKVYPFNLANKLGVIPNLVNQYIQVKAGDKIKKGDVIAKTNGFFGLFKATAKSPIDGEIENISSVTGQMLLREPRIPIQLKAFMDGKIIEIIPDEGVVIQAKATYIQGIFGIAGEVIGKINVLAKNPSDIITAADIKPEYKDSLIVTGALAPYDMILKAKEMGVAGIITGGLDDADLKKILGYDIGVAITGHEKLGITIVVTEGFGKIKMAEKTFELLKQNHGNEASIHGKTQIRAGVMRPEIIITVDADTQAIVDEKPKVSTLEIGTIIRVIREPNFGEIGTITSLPEELKKVESETLVRILMAKLGNGKEVLIPRANVEVIEN